MHSKAYASGVILSLLVPQTLTTPTSNPFSTLVATITLDVTTTLNSLLSSIGVSLQNNAAAHGSTWNWRDLNFPAVLWYSKRFSHSLNWPKKVNFVDWTTYKANGVNFGAWLEQEHEYDPIWGTPTLQTRQTNGLGAKLLVYNVVHFFRSGTHPSSPQQTLTRLLLSASILSGS
jgi:hypothetical protein